MGTVSCWVLSRASDILSSGWGNSSHEAFRRERDVYIANFKGLAIKKVLGSVQRNH